MYFADRTDAGRKLAAALGEYRGAPDTVVLGLPRGGVIVAHEVAQGLKLPLDIVAVRKIGAPDNPEFAIGAVAADGTLDVERAAVKQLRISPVHLTKLVARERREARRRALVYRAGRPPLTLQNKTVIVVDDGIATGHTVRTALASLHAAGVKRSIVAVPVAAEDTADALREDGFEVVCLYTPHYFGAVAGFYGFFPQNTDEEIVAIMKQSRVF